MAGITTCISTYWFHFTSHLFFLHPNAFIFIFHFMTIHKFLKMFLQEVTISKASNNQNTLSRMFLFCFSQNKIYSHTSVPSTSMRHPLLSFAYLTTLNLNFRASSEVTFPRACSDPVSTSFLRAPMVLCLYLSMELSPCQVEGLLTMWMFLSFARAETLQSLVLRLFQSKAPAVAGERRAPGNRTSWWDMRGRRLCSASAHT